MTVLSFLAVNPRFLAFGFFAALFSSFGQTFFIALSGAEIRAAFGLSHGDFGLLYAIATLSSAAVLVWAGRKIDDADLRLYTVIVAAGLAIACIGMAGVGGALWLVPVLFGLRFTGQGLMSHISMVSMARYFDQHRGKALSVAAMGFPFGEALFPTIVVATIAASGWRQMWAAIGTLVVIVIIPLMLWLLKGHSERHRRLDERTRADALASQAAGWTRRQVISDWRFYLLMPSFLAMSFIGTGFFFHQIHLADSKGWSLSLFVTFFAVYAAMQTLSALASGVLVDRFGAARMMRAYLLPAVVGLVFVAAFDTPWAGAVFMAFMGLTSGAVAVVHGAIWAEIYGIAHLGAIKALGTALMVLSSALSPPIMGLAIDAGVTMETIAWACALYILFAAGLVTAFFPIGKRDRG